MPKAADRNKKLVNIAEAKAQLSRLVKRVERGEVILIGRYGRVVAKLVPPDAPPKPKRVPGVWKGKVWIASDFDEPNADMARMTEEGPDTGCQSCGLLLTSILFCVKVKAER